MEETAGDMAGVMGVWAGGAPCPRGDISEGPRLTGGPALRTVAEGNPRKSSKGKQKKKDGNERNQYTQHGSPKGLG